MNNDQIMAALREFVDMVSSDEITPMDQTLIELIRIEYDKAVKEQDLSRAEMWDRIEYMVLYGS